MSQQFQTAHFSEEGKVRDKNEDAILSFTEQGIWIIADGMGGYEYGEIASRMIVDAFHSELLYGGLEQKIDKAKRMLLKVNHHLSQEKTLSHSAVIGSTVCMLIAHNGHIACLWAGDSRCYLFRHNKLYQISKDHTREQNGKEALTQAIGMGHNLSIEHCIIPLQHKDTFLLSSDGVHKYLSNNMIEACMALPSALKGCYHLKEQVLLTEANDNLSAIMIKANR